MQSLFALALLLAAAGLHASEPVLQVIKAFPGGVSPLQDGGFETRFPGAWRAAPNGSQVGTGGRSGSNALVCASTELKQFHGASQTVELNHTELTPVLIHGWSKAEGVSGTQDSEYSLYVDIVYSDGTPLWGRTAPFRTGTHDWEEQELVIVPEKPIKTLTLHCLFRNHTGKVWFDDIGLKELSAGQGVTYFQGSAVQPNAKVAPPSGKRRNLKTGDGLEMRLQGNTPVSLKVGGDELPRSAVGGGFLARDVAANSDCYDFSENTCKDLELKLAVNWGAQSDCLTCEGRLTSLAKRDRAVSFVFCIPVDATGWSWGDDIRRSRKVDGNAEFSNVVATDAGVTGTMSLYPLAVLHSSSAGLGVAMDMNAPAHYRLGYHSGLKQLFVSFDFGLVPETRAFPGAADFKFVIFTFDPAWGFRSGLAKLMKIFPKQFEVRAKDQGIWMPFTDISKVEGWEDFGFKFHEGNNNVEWDDQHGIASFRYTEPMTWWMRMHKAIPRTMAGALDTRARLATGPDEHQRTMASVCELAGMYNEEGQPCLMLRNEPWCDGAVWSLNPNPYLSSASASKATRTNESAALLNGATIYWNPDIARELYGPAAHGNLDGEYLDSLEGYVSADFNFRREHFTSTTVPLTFPFHSKKPALFKGLSVFEFTRWLSEDIHSRNKLMFANGVPYRFSFLCPWLDVLGTETDWLQNGRYEPAPDTRMSYWRSMAGQKPYLLLMNTDYDRFGSEFVERYFQRCLFYGMFPGMFSHNAADNPYWQNPKWYNRDRGLFKRYLPIIKQIAEAGWQPITGARCSNPAIYVERFGPGTSGRRFITVLNDTQQRQGGELTLDASAPGNSTAKLKSVLPESDGFQGTVSLEPQESRCYELSD